MKTALYGSQDRGCVSPPPPPRATESTSLLGTAVMELIHDLVPCLAVLGTADKRVIEAFSTTMSIVSIVGTLGSAFLAQNGRRSRQKKAFLPAAFSSCSFNILWIFRLSLCDKYKQ